MEQPFEVIGVWDNRGRSLDRYSIHILEDYDNDLFEYLICCSNNPTHPLGVFSVAESHQFDVGDHLGEEIDWGELPQTVKQMVINIINE